jgi:hypothetical protein
MIGFIARYTLPWRRHPLALKVGTWVLPDRYYAKLAYRVGHGRFPRTPAVAFNERLSALIGSGTLGKYAPYCDKLAVRDFVAGRVGAEYLVPLYASADTLTPELWERLPNAFMIKANHGSGWTRLVEDKKAENFDEIAEMCGRWLRTDYAQILRERQYQPIEPTLMFEQVLEDDRPGGLVDYKFFCFHGKAKLIQLVAWRPKKRRILYDLDWNKLAVRYNAPNHGDTRRPPMLDEMRTVAEKLAEGFPFVRVDLYNTPAGIHFGELTFTPLAGAEGFDPPAFDDYLGRLWADPDFSRGADMAAWRESMDQRERTVA